MDGMGRVGAGTSVERERKEEESSFVEGRRKYLHGPAMTFANSTTILCKFTTVHSTHRHNFLWIKNRTPLLARSRRGGRGRIKARLNADTKPREEEEEEGSLLPPSSFAFHVVSLSRSLLHFSDRPPKAEKGKGRAHPPQAARPAGFLRILCTLVSWRLLGQPFLPLDPFFLSSFLA